MTVRDFLYGNLSQEMLNSDIFIQMVELLEHSNYLELLVQDDKLMPLTTESPIINAQLTTLSCPTQHFGLPDLRKCRNQGVFLFFPHFHRPSQEQAGNGIGSKLHQPALHLREVLAGGHDVIHKKNIASLKINGMEYEVGELVEAVSALHLFTVFPYPSGTEAVGDFQAT